MSISETRSFDISVDSRGQSRLTWSRQPTHVMIFYKPNEVRVIKAFKQLSRCLIERLNMSVYIVGHRNDIEEEAPHENPDHPSVEAIYLHQDQAFAPIYAQIHKVTTEAAAAAAEIDLIICLGGDGTLLYVSDLFQDNVPPIMSFHMGSLGFLTPFKFKTHHDAISQVLRGGVPIVRRQRLRCEFFKSPDQPCGRRNSSSCTVKHVLNEVVVDRGYAGYLCNLNLFVDSLHVTCVQGDGVIISTPTGSTAYAAAAGSSMVHPNVPAIVVVPVCPHSLSFRPIVLPADRELKIMLSPDARGTAMVSLDGRQRCEMLQGDFVRITTSASALPSVCAQDPVYDWFSSLATCLHWNIRKLQRPLPKTRLDGEGSFRLGVSEPKRVRSSHNMQHLVQDEDSEDSEEEVGTLANGGGSSCGTSIREGSEDSER